MKRALLIAAAVVSLTAACSSDESAMGAPGCTDDLVLVAQSVPDAEFVPCFDELPGGWDAASVSVGHEGTTVKLDSDRAGSNAASFAYRDRCDVSRIGRLPSDDERIQVHEKIDQLSGGLESTRYFVFDGGCVTVRFDFDDFDDISHVESLMETMQLLRREDLNNALRDNLDQEVSLQWQTALPL